MGLCNEHYDLLKDEIKKTGLWPYVREDKSDMISAVKDQLATGKPTKKNYDQLANAFFAVLSEYSIDDLRDKRSCPSRWMG